MRGSVAEETEEGVAKALWTPLEANGPDGVVTGLSSSGDESLVPRDAGAQVYLIMQEAIRNVLKHSGCEEVTASLEIYPAELIGTVADDGYGFDPETAADGGHRAGIGLRSMRKRAEMVGREMNLTWHPGGKTIEIRVPLNANEPSATGGTPG